MELVLLMMMLVLLDGRVAKWLEHLTAERNVDDSSQTLGPKLECSLTVHPSANGYLVATLGKLKAAKNGTGQINKASLCRRLKISVLSNRHSPTYGIVYGADLYPYFTAKDNILKISISAKIDRKLETQYRSLQSNSRDSCAIHAVSGS